MCSWIKPLTNCSSVVKVLFFPSLFSAEEIERMKQALENNEDYKSIAAELGRMAKSVHNKMHALKAQGLSAKVLLSMRISVSWTR